MNKIKLLFPAQASRQLKLAFAESLLVSKPLSTRGLPGRNQFLHVRLKPGAIGGVHRRDSWL